jgi:hypothetical protein
MRYTSIRFALHLVAAFLEWTPTQMSLRWGGRHCLCSVRVATTVHRLVKVATTVHRSVRIACQFNHFVQYATVGIVHAAFDQGRN